MAAKPLPRPQWRIYALLTAVVVVMYVGAYTTLSMQGRYEAIFWGLGHVKARAWVPRGFETRGEWNMGTVYAFIPLYYYLDRKLWHTESQADSGRYPVNSDDYYMYGKPAKTNSHAGSSTMRTPAIDDQ